MVGLGGEERLNGADEFGRGSRAEMAAARLAARWGKAAVVQEKASA